MGRMCHRKSMKINSFTKISGLLLLAPLISNFVVFLFSVVEYNLHAAFARNCYAMEQQGIDSCFTDMKIAAVNCNSLNMSSANKPVQLRKIYALAKTRSDIILLSDIRLSKISTSGCVTDLKKITF